MQIQLYTNATASTFYVDAVLLLPVTGAYFDGSTPADRWFTHAWTGTAHASTSIEQIPTYVITPALVTGFSMARESGNIVHEIVGAEYPAVTYRPAKARRGTLELLFLTEADAAECVTAHLSEEVLTLWDDTWTSLPMRYSVAGPVTPELHFDTGRWLVAVDYVEVAPA